MARQGGQPGKVSRIDGDLIYIELTGFAPGFEFGPVIDTVGGLIVGDEVIALALARDPDEFIIIGLTALEVPYLNARIPGNTAVALGVVPYTPTSDTAAGWNATTKAYTVKRPGLYRIEFTYKVDINGASGAGSTPVHVIRKNGSGIYFQPNQPGGPYTGAHFAWSGPLLIGDTIDVNLFQGPYTTQDDGATVANNFLVIEYVRPS